MLVLSFSEFFSRAISRVLASLCSGVVYVYVDDLIGGMIKLMGSDRSITGPINIGNPNEFTMLELAELVLKLTSSQSKIIFKPLPEDDPKQRQPDISLAKARLDWEPKVKLEDGLKETIRYFKKVLTN